MRVVCDENSRKINRKKQKKESSIRLLLWPCVRRWQSSYTHVHTHTHMHTHTHTHRVGGEREREHLPTYKRNYCHLKRNPVYHAGAPKAPQVSFNMSKAPPSPPKLSMWSFIRPQQETSKQNTSPGGNPLSLSCT